MPIKIAQIVQEIKDAGHPIARNALRELLLGGLVGRNYDVYDYVFRNYPTNSVRVAAHFDDTKFPMRSASNTLNRLWRYGLLTRRKDTTVEGVMYYYEPLLELEIETFTAQFHYDDPRPMSDK